MEFRVTLHTQDKKKVRECDICLSNGKQSQSIPWKRLRRIVELPTNHFVSLDDLPRLTVYVGGELS